MVGRTMTKAEVTKMRDAQIERAKHEVCACGHLRIEHETQFELAVGHGPCARKRCKCFKYTWTPKTV